MGGAFRGIVLENVQSSLNVLEFPRHHMVL